MVRYAPAAEGGAALERLGDEIAELAAHVHAATGRLLLRLAEFDRRAGWAAPGFLSCAHWLSWRTGVAPGAAREKVRVARALTNLPLLAASLQSGELSYAKVRAITRVATPDNESDLLELARTATAAQVERVVRAWRRVDRLEEAAEERSRHRSRSLTVHSDVDGMVIVRGRLDPEAGALLERALAAAAEALHCAGSMAQRTRAARASSAGPTVSWSTCMSTPKRCAKAVQPGRASWPIHESPRRRRGACPVIRGECG
jgi:hypothetical protein